MPEFSAEDRKQIRQTVKDAFREALDETIGRENVVNALAMAQQVAWEFRIPPGDVLLKSIALFKLAAQSERDGNRVAILSPDNEIVEEVSDIREGLSKTDLAASGA